jgi:hypothetical protein
MADTQLPHIFSETGLLSLASQQRTGQIDFRHFTGVPAQWHTTDFHTTAYQHFASGDAGHHTALYSQAQGQGSSSTLKSSQSSMVEEYDSDFSDFDSRHIPKLVSFGTNKHHQREMSAFSASFPQLAKIIPFVIYIAITGAFTIPSVTEWLQKDSITSLLQLESIARWAFMTIVSLHSDSSYPPIEEGRTV